MIELKYLTFFAAGQNFAVDASFIQRIVRGMMITPVPTASAEVLGIASIKRMVVTILSLAQLFCDRENGDLPTIPNSHVKFSKTAIVFKPFSENDQFGFVTERLGELAEIDESAILPPSDRQAEKEASYIIGIAPYNKEFYRIIDISSIIGRFEEAGLHGGSANEN